MHAGRKIAPLYNPLPPYASLDQSLHSFLQAPREGRFALPASQWDTWGGHRPHVLIVTNQSILLQPWPERTVHDNWEFHYPPSSYRGEVLTQDEIDRIAQCRTRADIVAVLGEPTEELPDIFPLLPPFGGKPIGFNSRTTLSMYYRWFTVTKSDHIVDTYIQIGLARSNETWHVRSLTWNMGGYGSSNKTTGGDVQ
ncbi:MAG: hypothetical protein KAI66_24440 [Lentisphaeria bacterium]|nr:hypothetical protein [Lentisphaeria bacterium]